ncbi:homeobox-containing protein 1-like [Branchiostoma floridae]|uniref:Homeobox-containing protein 1-like n=1 Tax=Branchiostoma floridae TaxID=7739 RepID=A0A9J7HWC4_BRAFL|nr:homeobox-containing protein 1-like [Branchiostoma floridae]
MAATGTEPRFTLEQLDLLMRLRSILQRLQQTGLSQDSIFQALGTMQRIETVNTGMYGMSPQVNHVTIQPQLTAANPPQFIQAAPNSLFPATSIVTVPQGVVVANGTAPPPPPAAVVKVDSGGGAAATGMLQAKDILNTDTSAEPITEEALEKQVEELLSKNIMDVKEEINKFLHVKGIPQGRLAQATGISSSYVSLFLKQGLDMTAMKKRAIYTWFLRQKHRKPGRSTGNQVRSHDLHLVLKAEAQETSTRDRASEKSHLVPSGPLPNAGGWKWQKKRSLDDPDYDPAHSPGNQRRGSKFHWPPSAVMIVEKYFQQNPYPTEGERDEIANACNSVLQKPGEDLPSYKLVSPVRVQTWFINRRREAKIKQQQEQYAADNGTRQSPRLEGKAMSFQEESDMDSESAESPSTGAALNTGEQNQLTGNRQNTEDMDPARLEAELAAVNRSIMVLVNQHEDEETEEKKFKWEVS